MLRARWSDNLQLATLYLTLFACFSLNLPTAFISVSSGLMLLTWALSGHYKTKYSLIISNFGLLSSLYLLGAIAMGTLYSTAPTNDSLHYFMKYQKLLLIPIIATTLCSDESRKYAINIFLISTIIVMAISYLKWLGLVPHHDVAQGFIVFKNRISGSIIMSFAMYAMLLKAKKSSGSHRGAWIALSLMAAVNISLLVNGRTGQITMLALMAWFTFETWGIKSIKYWVGASLLALILVQLVPEKLPTRLGGILQEIKDHNTTGAQTSAGQRLEFYRNSLELIQTHPVFGGGTGSFPIEYKALTIKKNTPIATTNPHNQFILTLSELGVVGLLVLLSFWISHWYLSYRISNEYGQLLRGLIITITVGSLFNSLLLDASEGKFYCVIAGVLLSAYNPKDQEK